MTGYVQEGQELVPPRYVELVCGPRAQCTQAQRVQRHVEGDQAIFRNTQDEILAKPRTRENAES